MSEYRQLHRSFWESQSVEELDPVEKLAYLYLITGPQSNMEGIYKLSLRRMALETGLEKETCARICTRLEQAKLGGWFDGWACVTQATAHMPSGPKMRVHAEKLYAEIPKVVTDWMQLIGYTYPFALD